MSEQQREPAWLTHLIDQRVAPLQELDLSGHQIVLLTLTEPIEGSTPEVTERWERTCDKCGRYCPPHPEGEDPQFYTGQAMRIIQDRQVIISFGLCAVCVAEYV